ncbi:hypothetical protein JCM10207_009216 [Rhodosporidiobolus poonsookiae]
MADALQQQQQPTQDQPNRPHACSYPGCSQAYARIEHKERHEKTHQPGNGYTCPKCDKTFARSDVLRRHSKIHDRGATVEPAEGINSSTKRCPRACNNCATGKVRCSGETPRCQRCIEFNKTCVYDGTAVVSRPPKRVRLQSEPVQDMQVSETGGSDGEDGADQPSQSHEARYDSINVDDLPFPPPASSSAGDDDSLGDALQAALSAHGPAYSVAPQPPTFSIPPQPPTFPPAPSQAAPFASSALFHPHSTTALPFYPSQPTPSSSGGMLDTVLDLAFQQQAPNSTLEHDLAAAFYLPTHDGMFWSQFLNSPPAAVPLASSAAAESSAPAASNALAPQTPASSVMTAETSSSFSAHRSRILITAAGLPSRHGSPRPEDQPAADEEPAGLPQSGGAVIATLAGAAKRDGRSPALSSRWPHAWNPTGDESQIRLDGEASKSLLSLAAQDENGAFPAASSLPKFDEEVRMALLETLRFSQLGDDEYHALYRTLSRVPLPVFDLLCNLFFHHFHSNLPFLHVPSFHPKKTLGQLLMIILGIGAVYAPISGALQLGRVLVEVARRGLEHLINRDNRLARSLPVAQSQMLWSTTRWIGSARAVELASVFSGVHTSMLRFSSAFDESNSYKPVNDSPAAQWSAFIANEERRRTAMACFILEGEVTTLLHRPPSISWNDLKTLMPASDDLWNAPTAEAWLQAKASTPDPPSIPLLAKLLSSESTLSLPASVPLTPLGAHVLTQGLHLNVHHARQLHQSGMGSHAELITTQIRRSLSRLARGKDEFSPRFAGKNGSTAEQDDPAAYAGAHVWYHLAHITTHIALEELDIVAHKSSGVEAVEATKRWLQWFSLYPEKARAVALHAGQIYRVVRDYPTNGTYEPSALFYAGLALYLYARSVSSSSSSNFQGSTVDSLLSWSVSSSSSSSPSSSLAAAFRLDADLQAPDAPDASTWLALGGAAALGDVSTVLAGSKAAAEVVRATASLLAGQVGWRISQNFAGVLDAIAKKDQGEVAPL